MNYTDGDQFYRPYLVNDEYVLWTGRPEKGNIFTKHSAVLMIFGAVWLSFSLFWEIMAIKSKVVFMMLWGLPFVGIGAYLLLESPIRAAYLRNRTYYVITNKKIIIKKGSKIEMHDGRDLPPMDIEIHKNGNGTILFSEDVYTRRGRSHRIYFMLENLADIAQAQNAVSSMEREEPQPYD